MTALRLSPARALAGLCLAALPACGGERARPPSIVLITLDTTRADRLSCYGYGRETTPRLDALAREGVLYTRAQAVSSWTLPAHAALFTGRFTTSHGARYDPEGPVRLSDAVDRSALDEYRARPLIEAETTLAELCAARGYRTAGFVAGPWMMRLFGLAQGFETWDDSGIDSLRGRLAADVTDAALAWLGALDEDQPFLLFANYYDPHGPYGAPVPHTLRFVAGAPPAGLDGWPRAYLREIQAREQELLPDLYDGELYYTDCEIGRLFDGLRALERYQDCAIVVVGDHGELLGEKGLWGHGEDLSECELAVPLIVRPPGGLVQDRSDDRPAQQTDVLPILFELLALPVPASVQGRLPAPNAPLFSELYALPQHRRQGLWRTLRVGDLKLYAQADGALELYDLSNDALEERDLARARPERAAELAVLLEAWARSLPGPGEAPDTLELDAETLRALQSLGYVK